METEELDHVDPPRQLFLPMFVLVLLTGSAVLFVVLHVLGLDPKYREFWSWLGPIAILQCGVGIPFGLLIAFDDDCPKWMRWTAWTHVVAAPLMFLTGIGTALMRD